MTPPSATLRWPWLLLGVGLLLSGCSFLLDPETCASDEDCLEGEACQSNVCITSTPDADGGADAAADARPDAPDADPAADARPPSDAQPASGGPRITILSPLEGAEVAEAAVVFSGEVLSERPLASIVLKTIGGQQVDAEISPDGTSWSGTVTLPTPGQWDVDVIGTDSAGASQIAWRQIIWDDTEISLEIVEPEEGACLPGEGTRVCARITDAGGVAEGSVRIGGLEATLDEGDVYCATLALAGGARSVQATASDPAGRVASSSVNVTVDEEPPSLVFTRPRPGGMVAALNGQLTVEGEISDDGCGMPDQALTVQGAPVAVRDDGRFNTQLEVEAGEQSIQWLISDRVGNTQMVDLHVNADVEAPSLELLSPVDVALTAETTAQLAAIVSDAGAGVAGITLNGVEIEGTPVEDRPEAVRVEAPLQLVQGRNVFNLRAFDGVGLSIVRTIELTADSMAPSVVIDEVTVVGGDQLTLSVTGHADDGPNGSGVAEVRLNGDAVVFDPETGGWRVEALQVPPGLVHLEAVATDVLGNTSEPAVLDLDRDVTPPVITLTDAELVADACTRDPNVNLCAQVGDPENAIVEVLVNGVPEAISPLGTFCSAQPLDPGENTLTITATNEVGLEGTLQIRVTRDQTPPEVVFDLPEGGYIDGASHNGQVVLTGQITDGGCGVEPGSFVFGGEVVELDERGRFSITLPVSPIGLQEGANIRPWRVVDGAGNLTSNSLQLIVDLDPPDIELRSPATAQALVLNVDRYILDGVISDQWSGVATAMLDGEPLTLQPEAGVPGGGRFQQEVILEEGLNTFTLEAVDNVGLSRTLALEVRVFQDATPPSLTIEEPLADACVNDPQLLVCGQVTEDATPLGDVRVQGQLVLPEFIDEEGRFCFPVPTLNGPASVTVTAENLGGLATAQTVEFFADLQPPGVVWTSPRPGAGPLDATGGLLFSGQVLEEGCGLDDAVVSLRHPEFIDPIEIPLDPVGAFAANLEFEIEGQLFVGYSIVDQAGNFTEGQLDVWVDKAGPLIQLVSPPESGLTVEQPFIILNFEVQDAARSPIESLTLNGAPLDLGPNAEFGTALVQTELELSAGVNELEIVATDATGFTTEEVVVINFDRNAGALEPRTSFQAALPLEGIDDVNNSWFDAIAVSPDGVTVAAAYKDTPNNGAEVGHLGLWRRHNGSLVWMSEQTLWTEGCEFHPTGQWIICAHVNYPDLQAFEMRVFDAEDGTLAWSTPVQIELGESEAQLFDGFSASVSPDGDWAAASAAGPQGSQVMVFSLNFTGRPIHAQTFEFLGQNGIDETAFNAEGDVLYATDFAAQALHRFELVNGSWQRTPSMPQPSGVAGLDVDGEGRVVMSAYFGQAVYIVEPDPDDFANSPRRIVPVDGRSYDLCADPRPGAHWAWAVSQNAGQTQAIDTATGEVLASDRITPHHNDGLSYSCDPLSGQPYAVSRSQIWTWLPAVDDPPAP